MIQAVVFDLDGVLIDSERLWDQARRDVTAQHHGHWRAEATSAMQGMSSVEWSRYLRDDLGVQLPADQIVDLVVRDLLARYARGLPLIPGAVAAVRRIGRRWPLGLASSANRVVIDEVLALAGLRDAFGATVSSEEVPQGKPAPDVYLEAARRLGRPPGACAAVEDSGNGIRSAAAAGMYVVAIPNRDYPPPADALARADLVLDTLSDLTTEKLEALGSVSRVATPDAQKTRQGVAMTATGLTPTTSLDAAAELAAQLRVDSIRSSTSAGSGHPTSSMSAADLLAVLVTRHLRYDWDDPHTSANDHLIFSKGHASPLLYSVFKAVGVVSEDELINGYRRFGQRLEGHPTPVLPWVDVATGSLGQGLPDAVGVALAGRYLDKLPYRVWVLCGDSELAEGSIWEALDKAEHYGLSNLIVLADINRLGQSGPTEFGWNIDAYARRAEAFGARTLEIDGHDPAAIDDALAKAGQAEGDQATVILAKTIKGRGFSEVEDKEGWHGKPLPPDMAERAIAELGGVRSLVVRGPVPEPAAPATPEPAKIDTPMPEYKVGDKIATRKAYGDALVALGARNPKVVALDGEVKNSTFAEEFAHAYPDRYFEMYIAEQQMIASATGLAVRGYHAFASTFAAFLTRAYDFIRMGSISGVNLALMGSHAGVEIGADGPSQMALEDLAMMRAVHGSTVLYPADGTSTVVLVEAMATNPGISYLRTTRGSYPGLYPAGEAFPIGGSKVLRSSDHDDVTLVGAGVTLHACLAAADVLRGEGISARVIDCYSVKPIDAATLTAAVEATAGRIVIAEDHHPEGGLGSAVTDALLAGPHRALSVAHLAVRGMPGSGTGEELLAWAGIDTTHIAAAARQLTTT